MQCVTAFINKQALIDNIKVIKAKVPNSKIIAVVKANAYGHGLIAVADALKERVDSYAVSRISEAMELRRHGIEKQPIVLLEGFYNDEDLAYISKFNLFNMLISLSITFTDKFLILSITPLLKHQYNNIK